MKRFSGDDDGTQGKRVKKYKIKRIPLDLASYLRSEKPRPLEEQLAWPDRIALTGSKRSWNNDVLTKDPSFFLLLTPKRHREGWCAGKKKRLQKTTPFQRLLAAVQRRVQEGILFNVCKAAEGILVLCLRRFLSGAKHITCCLFAARRRNGYKNWHR